MADLLAVFPSSKGTEMAHGNVLIRVLQRAVDRANENLAKQADVPLPAGLTPHKLRHTFASILVALGEDPGSVMDQLGHADPGFTLRVYRHGMRRDPDAKRRLRALVEGTNGHYAAKRPHRRSTEGRRPGPKTAR
jgi:integrase